jgi:hypothetical protein
MGKVLLLARGRISAEMVTAMDSSDEDIKLCKVV